MPLAPLTFSAGHFADRALSTIVLTYASFAALWILLSDQVVALLFSDPRTIVLISTIKGWLFVAVTSILLALLVRRYLNKLVDVNRALKMSNERLVDAEVNLLKLNSQLDQRVRERTAALQASTAQLQLALGNLRDMQEKLVQSEKQAALGSIVAAVAHELNTPLGNCLTVATTLQDKTADFEQQIHAGALRRSQLSGYLDASRSAMELMLRGLQRAVSLVSNFKQVAVDQYGGQRRVFQLKGVIDRVVASMQPELSQTPYRIDVQVPDDLQMDSFPGAIEQVVTNLINNSVLHGFAGRDHGLITLQARANDDQIRVVYRDDGCGMSRETCSHVFDPFFTTRLGKGSSGLGMSICYNLVTGRLGGTIEIDSAIGQGTVVVLLLPPYAPMNETLPGSSKGHLSASLH